MANDVLTIQVSFDEESMAAMKALTAAMAAQGAPADDAPDEKPKAEKPKATTKPKADAKKETKKEEPAEEPADEESSVTKEDIRAKLKEYGKVASQDQALAILKKYGAGTMSALKEEDYQACYDEVCAAIEEAGDGDPLDD